jgi:isopentenyldiphosphate isomerase
MQAHLFQPKKWTHLPCLRATNGAFWANLSASARKGGRDPHSVCASSHPQKPSVLFEINQRSSKILRSLQTHVDRMCEPSRNIGKLPAFPSISWQGFSSTPRVAFPFYPVPSAIHVPRDLTSFGAPFDLLKRSSPSAPHVSHGKRFMSTVLSNPDLIDVLDENGLRTGEVLPRKEIHKQGKLHRAVHLYLFDKSGKILLQQRSKNVDHYPELWGISLTGHIDAGESSTTALQREIQEELGLNPEKMKVSFLFSYRRDAVLNQTYIDRQFNDVYACFHDFKLEDIKFERSEVQAIDLIPFSRFKEMAEDTSGKSALAPVYGRACVDVLYYLRAAFLPQESKTEQEKESS